VSEVVLAKILEKINERANAIVHISALNKFLSKQCLELETNDDDNDETMTS
jgi:hypothetical protein